MIIIHSDIPVTSEEEKEEPIFTRLKKTIPLLSSISQHNQLPKHPSNQCQFSKRKSKRSIQIQIQLVVADFYHCCGYLHLFFFSQNLKTLVAINITDYPDGEYFSLKSHFLQMFIIFCSYSIFFEGNNVKI